MLLMNTVPSHFQSNFSLPCNSMLPAVPRASKSPGAESNSSSDASSSVSNTTATSSRRQSHDVGFSFVNVAHPSDARGSHNKRAIRSHVAKVQHSKTRISASLESSKATKAQTQKRSIHPRPKLEPKASSTESRSTRSNGSDDVQEEPDSVTSNALMTLTDVMADMSSQDLLYRYRQDSHVTKSQNDLLQSSSDSDSSFLLMTRNISGGQMDPFWTYPVPYHPNLESSISHYVTFIAIDIPFIVPDTESGLLKRAWLPLAVSEPTIFYAMVLISATHQAALNPSTANNLNVLALKGKVIRLIQDALNDPTKCMSDVIIGAVIKMASYEALFGDEAHFLAHMAGLQQMVRMRGGLSNLGMNGLLERLILWIDSNAGYHLQKGLMFDPKSFPSKNLHPIPEPFHFGESMIAQKRKD